MYIGMYYIIPPVSEFIRCTCIIYIYTYSWSLHCWITMPSTGDLENSPRLWCINRRNIYIYIGTLSYRPYHRFFRMDLNVRFTIIERKNKNRHLYTWTYFGIRTYTLSNIRHNEIYLCIIDYIVTLYALCVLINSKASEPSSCRIANYFDYYVWSWLFFFNNTVYECYTKIQKTFIY